MKRTVDEYLELAERIIDTKYTFKEGSKKIFAHMEDEMFPMEIKFITDEFKLDLNEIEKIHVFLGYFVPNEKNHPDHEYLVYILSNDSEDLGYFIVHRIDCCKGLRKVYKIEI